MKKATTIILIVMLIAGLSLLVYPSFSDYWNKYHASRAVAAYAEKISDMDNSELEKMWKEAEAFNKKIQYRKNIYRLSEEEEIKYNNLLNADNNGIMGYVEVPNIDVTLPLYHGVDESVLAVATGHIEWTSLPVGGESTHCVISGHRGLPSAKLFTNLDKVTEGDVFTLSILDKTLTYEVDQILIVEPNDTEALMIEKGKDYCTLVTCTPYGVNSHRLLVRGHRIENIQEVKTVRIISDAMQIEPVIVAPVIAAPILLILLLVLLFQKDGRGKKKARKKQ